MAFREPLLESVEPVASRYIRVCPGVVVESLPIDMRDEGLILDGISRGKLPGTVVGHFADDGSISWTVQRTAGETDLRDERTRLRISNS